MDGGVTPTILCPFDKRPAWSDKKMMEAALLCIVIKHIGMYYLFNERFTESLWDKQLGLSLLGVAVFGMIAVLFPIAEYPDRRHDFTAPCLFVISFLLEYLMTGLIKPIRRSVGQVIMNTHGFDMSRALLRSRTFIAVFSLYLVTIVISFIVVRANYNSFLYP